MNRKDLDKLARVVKRLEPGIISLNARRSLALRMQAALAEEEIHFDLDKWMARCGVSVLEP